MEAERDAYHCSDCGEIFEAKPLRFRLETSDGNVVLRDEQKPECPNCASRSTNVATEEEFSRCICGAEMEDLGIDKSIIFD